MAGFSVVHRGIDAERDGRGVSRSVLSSGSSGVLIDVTKPPYNVLPGVTADCGAGIDQAIIDANAAGGGRVIIPHASSPYTSALRKIGSYSAMFFMRSNVTVEMQGGATVLLAPFVTIPASTTQAYLVGTLNPYNGSPTLAGAVLEGGLLDGNGANQNYTLGSYATQVTMGVFLYGASNCVVNRTKVQGLLGNAGFGVGETFHFEANHSAGVLFYGCESDGSRCSSATGFSSDDSFDVTWVACRSHDMSVGQGFTSWEGSGLAWIGCKSYRNGFAGFNMELVSNSNMTGCVSGGLSPDASPLAGAHNPFFAGNAIQLGNGGPGIILSGCTDIAISGGSSTYNNINFELAIETTGGLTTPNDGIMVNGVDLRSSQGASADGTQDIIISGAHTNWSFNHCLYFVKPTLGSQTFAGSFSSSPIQVNNVKQAPSVGSVITSTGHTQTAAAFSHAWRYDKTGSGSLTAMSINGVGQHQTTGRARARRAVADVAATFVAADDILGWTSITAARAATLPLLANVAVGTEFQIADESGNASGVLTITFTPSGSDTIHGATAVTSAYGIRRVYSTGATWIAI